MNFEDSIHKKYISPLFQEIDNPKKNLEFRVHSSLNRSLDKLVRSDLLVHEGNLNYTTVYILALEHLDYLLNRSNYGSNVMVFAIPKNYTFDEIFRSETIKKDGLDYDFEEGIYHLLKNEFLVGAYNKNSKEIKFNPNYRNYADLDLNYKAK